MNFEEIEKANREDLEKDLTFAGLIIMENKLKPATKGAID